METLLAAYAVAWAAVSAYVAWISIGNSRLARRLERLESTVRDEPIKTVTRAKAA